MVICKVDGKMIHKSEYEAEVAAADMVRLGRYQYVYFSDSCNRWHLSTCTREEYYTQYVNEDEIDVEALDGRDDGSDYVIYRSNRGKKAFNSILGLEIVRQELENA